MNNVQVGLFTFGVKYECYDYTDPTRRVHLTATLSLSARIDVGMTLIPNTTHIYVYKFSFTENNLNMGCFGLIESESFGLIESESFVLYMSHLVQRVHVHLLNLTVVYMRI